MVMASSNILFNSISKIYGRFFNFQLGYFNKILDRAKPHFDISQYESILDVGCGTGALAKVLYDNGLKVTGVDTAKGMIEQASKRLEGKDIKLFQTTAGESLPFPDNSFDIVISSYVAHGLKLDNRMELYEEMKRVAKEYVILHDYNEKRALHTNIVEFFEGGDYFNFIKSVKDELNTVFPSVKTFDVDTRAAWYVCKK